MYEVRREMNRIIRAAAFTGLGLAVGVVVSSGPAQAATNTSSSDAHHTATQARGHWDDNTDVVGYYSSLRRCERAGSIGEFRNRWEDHDCTRVRRGFHRGAWALEVDYGFNDNNWDDNGNGDWSGHHGWHGHGHPNGGAVVFPLGPGA